MLLITAGLQTPVKPSFDQPSNTGTVPPVQMLSDVPILNVGVMFGLTHTSTVVVVAHCPGFGVNV